MADEALSAGAVARRLGVAVTTLRTWHQRYGLGPSRHVPGQHRRYTAQDLNRLEVMLRLTSQGVAPAEAAAWARRTPESSPSPATPESSASAALASSLGLAPGFASIPSDGIPPDGIPPAGISSGGIPLAGIPSAGRTASESAGLGEVPVPGRGPDGGGLAIPLGHVVPAARGLARAAMRLDTALMAAILTAAVAETGVIAAWNEVALPVLIGIGERYAATRRFVEVEHLISRCVTEVLGAVPRPPAPPRVLLAAADEEQHTLPLEALAAALAEEGIPTRLLGARVPPQALDDTITRTGPTAVILWSSMPHTGDLAQLTRVATHPHPPVLLAAAGPGWPSNLPPGVAHLTALLPAIELARAAAA